MKTTKVRPQLLDITIRAIPDDDGGRLSDLGKYHDAKSGPDDWDICRRTGEFVHDMRETARREFAESADNRAEWEEYYSDEYPEYDNWVADNWEDSFTIPRESREYSFFRPYAAGEKHGTDDYRKYGLMDYRRAEDYGNGWSFIGIRAEATVEINGREQILRSGGVWGIESDSGSEYLAEVAAEEFAQLSTDLRVIGITARAIANAKPDFSDIRE